MHSTYRYNFGVFSENENDKNGQKYSSIFVCHNCVKITYSNVENQKFYGEETTGSQLQWDATSNASRLEDIGENGKIGREEGGRIYPPLLQICNLNTAAR